MTAGIPIEAGELSDWARALTDPEEFTREQAMFGRQWTLLGLGHDLANDGDWIKATLGSRSVFVQRFGNSLKGFENVCAHRSYPLRTQDKGNGPIVCGFHHWRYDQDGRALGIPMCQDNFGVIPRELGARLNPIEIASCGNFIFGRFPGAGPAQSLEQDLGEAFPILEAMSQSPRAPSFATRTVKANWKLCFHTSLDDYHIVAVHPDTFGKDGYVKREGIGYHRFGSHSAYFTTPAPDALSKMATACRDGTWQSANYRIFHIFPNLAVAHFHTDATFWYVLVLQYVPVAANLSTMRAWFYPSPFASNHNWINRWTSGLTDLSRRHFIRFYIRKVLNEDHAVCEQHQAIAHQIEKRPVFGAMEERIFWFQEAYASAVGAGKPAEVRAAE